MPGEHKNPFPDTDYSISGRGILGEKLRFIFGSGTDGAYFPVGLLFLYSVGDSPVICLNAR